MHLTSGDAVSKRLLSVAFASILVLLVLLEGLAYVESRASQRRVGEIVTNALRSVELAGQLGMDVQRERTLTERHILETTPAQMDAVDRELRRNRADLRVVAKDYVSTIAFPGERGAWLRLILKMRLKDQLAPEVITLSRANRDAEAKTYLLRMQPIFDAIQADAERLIAINRTGAEHASQHMRDSQGAAVRFRIALGLGIGVLFVVIGLLLTRVLARNESVLRAKTRELEEKNRDLDAFAGRVAHDLRGPLSTISVASHLLSERLPDQRKTTSILQRGVTQMTTLVEELLELSRIGALTDASTRTEPVAAALLEDLQPRVRETGGTLRVDLEPANVRCSTGLLRELLWNLAENALKYRRPDLPAAIAVTGRVYHGLYEIAVADNGLGMSHDDADHVFEPFYRAERTRKVAGTGLGMAIVRRIVDACRGTISVTSEVGQGTRVDIRLPLAGGSA